VACKFSGVGLGETATLQENPKLTSGSGFSCAGVRDKAESSVPLTESQTGRGWKGPLWVTQPNPLPKQGHPEQAAQELVQAGFEYL